MVDRHAAPLVWIDMEMSGLDPEVCHVLEIATIVTDAELDVIAEGPEIIVHQADAVLEAMDEWCTTHHGQSGLTAAVRASEVSLAEAEARTLAFLRAHSQAGVSLLCGNSVDRDRLFIERHMPQLDAFLHAENLDVTTIKELARRWYPDVEPPPKADTHRALEDIRESIAELRFYRERLLVPSAPSQGARDADR